MTFLLPSLTMGFSMIIIFVTSSAKDKPVRHISKIAIRVVRILFIVHKVCIVLTIAKLCKTNLNPMKNSFTLHEGQTIEFQLIQESIENQFFTFQSIND